MHFVTKTTHGIVCFYSLSCARGRSLFVTPRLPCLLRHLEMHTTCWFFVLHAFCFVFTLHAAFFTSYGAFFRSASSLSVGIFHHASFSAHHEYFLPFPSLHNRFSPVSLHIVIMCMAALECARRTPRYTAPFLISVRMSYFLQLDHPTPL